jgi:hypothetical protein
MIDVFSANAQIADGGSLYSCRLLSAGVGCEGPNRIADRANWAPLRRGFGNWRALLQSSEQRSGVHSKTEGNEPILRPHGFHKSPLARGQHLDRQSLKIAENPKKVQPLSE